MRTYYSDKITKCRSESTAEHQKMVNCFERADEFFHSGQGAEAYHWSRKGRRHQERRNNLQDQAHRLIQELQDMKQEVRPCAPAAELAAFEEAHDVHKQAKQHCHAAHAEFHRLKNERNRLKTRFERLQADFSQIHAKRKKLQANNG